MFPLGDRPGRWCLGPEVVGSPQPRTPIIWPRDASLNPSCGSTAFYQSRLLDPVLKGFFEQCHCHLAHPPRSVS